MMNRKALPLVLVWVIGMLGGCSAANNSIRGKVIEGTVSFVLEVPKDDPRLQATGLEGVSVEARSTGGRGSGDPYAKATSSKTGEFRLYFGDQQAVLLKQIEFVGEKEGFSPSKVVMSLPSTERRLLIVLQPQGPAPKPSR